MTGHSRMSEFERNGGVSSSRITVVPAATAVTASSSSTTCAGDSPVVVAATAAATSSTRATSNMTPATALGVHTNSSVVPTASAVAGHTDSLISSGTSAAGEHATSSCLYELPAADTSTASGGIAAVASLSSHSSATADATMSVHPAAAASSASVHAVHSPHVAAAAVCDDPLVAASHSDETHVSAGDSASDTRGHELAASYAAAGAAPDDGECLSPALATLSLAASASAADEGFRSSTDPDESLAGRPAGASRSAVTECPVSVDTAPLPPSGNRRRRVAPPTPADASSPLHGQLLLRAPLPRPSLRPYEVLVTRRLPLIVYFRRCMQLLSAEYFLPSSSFLKRSFYRQRQQTGYNQRRSSPSPLSQQQDVISTLQQQQQELGRCQEANQQPRGRRSQRRQEQQLLLQQQYRQRFPSIIIRGTGGCMRTAVWLAQDVVRALGGKCEYALSSSIDPFNAYFVTTTTSTSSTIDNSACRQEEEEQQQHHQTRAPQMRRQESVRRRERQQQLQQQEQREQEDGTGPFITLHVETYTVKSVDTLWKTTAADVQEGSLLRDEDLYSVTTKERFVSGIAITITRPPPPPPLPGS